MLSFIISEEYVRFMVNDIAAVLAGAKGPSHIHRQDKIVAHQMLIKAERDGAKGIRYSFAIESVPTRRYFYTL